MPCAEGDRSGVLDPKNEGWGSHDSGGRRVRNNKETDAFKLRGSSGTPNPTKLAEITANPRRAGVPQNE